MLQKQSKSDYITIDELWNGLKVNDLLPLCTFFVEKTIP